MTLLQRDAELQEVVQLVGPDALQDQERLILEIARMIRETFLQQNAFSDNDAFCTIEKMAGLMELLVAFYDECEATLRREIPLSRIMELPIREEISRMKDQPNQGFTAKKDELVERMRQTLRALELR